MGMKAVSSPNETAMIAAAVAQMLINDTIESLSDEISQAVRLTTNAQGRVLWTYPRPFAAPPVVSVDVIITASNQPYSIREISRTATGCEYLVLSSPALVVALVGLTLLGVPAAVGAGIEVDIVAKRATP